MDNFHCWIRTSSLPVLEDSFLGLDIFSFKSLILGALWLGYCAVIGLTALPFRKKQMNHSCCIWRFFKNYNTIHYVWNHLLPCFWIYPLLMSKKSFQYILKDFFCIHHISQLHCFSNVMLNYTYSVFQRDSSTVFTSILL